MIASTIKDDFAKTVKVRTLETGISVLDVENKFGTATISLFGGQVLAWRPLTAEHPVLWTSSLAILDGSKAIRGGVPVCWPWFGAHPESAAQPAHGCARLHSWRLDDVRSATDGTTEIGLSFEPVSLPPDEPMSRLTLTQTIRIGPALDIGLTTTNTGSSTCRYTEGLHTYFQVKDIDAVEVTGLNQREYLDLTRQNQRCRQSQGIRFGAEVGQLFVGTTDTCVLHDAGWQRNIRVEKSGSLSTAIWNPGLEVASRMSDLGDQGWREMVCVESANAADDAIHLRPGATHTLAARYSVEPYTPA